MKKERILNFDFIRAVAALLIVFYHIVRQFEIIPAWDHFVIHSTGPNGDWGHYTVVALFFMLSAVSLLYNYPELTAKDLKGFYFRRWKSVFPTFYLVWICADVVRSIQSGTPFWGGPPVTFLLTLIGEDGYAQYLGLEHDYYLVGEWFLGVIILLYVLYPLLLALYRRLFLPTTIVITVLFFVLHHDGFISYLFPFWCGFVYLRLRETLRSRKWTALLFLAAMLLFLLVPFPVVFWIPAMTLAGICLFPVLDFLSDLLMRFRPVSAFFLFTSGLSYELFLVHHRVIFFISGYLTNFVGSDFTIAGQWFFALGVFVISFFLAKAVSLLMKDLFRFVSSCRSASHG